MDRTCSGNLWEMAAVLDSARCPYFRYGQFIPIGITSDRYNNTISISTNVTIYLTYCNIGGDV